VEHMDRFTQSRIDCTVQSFRTNISKNNIDFIKNYQDITNVDLNSLNLKMQWETNSNLKKLDRSSFLILCRRFRGPNPFYLITQQMKMD